MVSKPNQPDLFGDNNPGAVEEPSRTDSIKSLFRFKNPLYSISLEHIFIALIVLIILFVMVFMMGVLRGKAIQNKTGAAVVRTFEPTVLPASAQGQRGGNVVTARLPALPAGKTTPAAASKTAVLPGQGAKIAPKNAALQPFANDPAKPYTIQIITYRSEDRALKEVALLQAAGFQPKMITKGGYSLVFVGQYANRKEAEKDLRSLQTRYKDCYLRKI